MLCSIIKWQNKYLSWHQFLLPASHIVCPPPGSWVTKSLWVAFVCPATAVCLKTASHQNVNISLGNFLKPKALQTSPEFTIYDPQWDLHCSRLCLSVILHQNSPEHICLRDVEPVLCFLENWWFQLWDTPTDTDITLGSDSATVSSGADLWDWVGIVQSPRWLWETVVSYNTTICIHTF